MDGSAFVSALPGPPTGDVVLLEPPGLTGEVASAGPGRMDPGPFASVVGVITSAGLDGVVPPGSVVAEVLGAVAAVVSAADVCVVEGLSFPAALLLSATDVDSAVLAHSVEATVPDVFLLIVADLPLYVLL